MSEVRADTFTDAVGSGAPNFPNNLEVSGTAVTPAIIAAASNITVLQVATDYTVLDTDNVRTVEVTSGGVNRTVLLPTASDNAGRVVTIKKVDLGVGNVTVDGEGAETIDGAATTTISTQNDSITVQCNGTGWVIIERTLYISPWTDISSDVSSGQAGWVLANAYGQAYVDFNGQWAMDIAIDASITSSSANVNVTLTGMDALFSQTLATTAAATGAAAGARVFSAGGGDSTISQNTTAARSTVAFCGKVILASRPTWAV
jgi:hypothetical protein